MTLGWFVILLLVTILGLPTLAYMVMKFGAAGYFKSKLKAIEDAKQQQKERERENEDI